MCFYACICSFWTYTGAEKCVWHSTVSPAITNNCAVTLRHAVFSFTVREDLNLCLIQGLFGQLYQILYCSQLQQKVHILIWMKKANFWQDQNRWVSAGVGKVQIISSNSYSFSVVLILTPSHLLWHHGLETSCSCQKQNITTWKMLHQVCYLINEKLSDYCYYYCCCCYYYYYYYWYLFYK